MSRLNYPIGIQSFEKIREGGYVYVDKTELIYKLVNGGAIFFLSRPRRFGKSLLLSTIEAYFQGKRELFTGLAMEQLEHDWEEHVVFHLDFSRGNFREQDFLSNSIERFLSSNERMYGADEIEKSFSDRFAGLIKRAHQQSGRHVVVLVDEYDKPLLDVIDDETCLNDKGRLMEESNRELLKELYSTFKSCDDDLRFVMLTGITKFSQVSIFSGFNQPEDISMNRNFETICGITEEELRTCFKEPIAAMAAEEGCSDEALLGRLKQHYDGYHFCRRLTDLYNPFSLLNAFKSGEIRDYWFASGSPTYLIRLMNHTAEQIDNILRINYPESAFMDYKADKERPLPMLFQSGYLTIKAYDRESDLYELDFPNNEVRNGFLTLLASNYLHTDNGETGSVAGNSVKMLNNGQTEALHILLT